MSGDYTDYLAAWGERISSPEHRERMKKEQAKEIAQYKAQATSRRVSGFPSREQDVAADLLQDERAGDRSPAFRWLMETIESDEWKAGESAMMIGKYGCGKTVAACAAALTLSRYERSTPCMYLKAYKAAMLLEKNEWGRLANLADHEKIRVLVIDEVHRMKELGGFIQVALKGLIDARYDARMTTLILGTVPVDQAATVLGSEIIDRVHPRLRWTSDPKDTSKRWT